MTVQQAAESDMSVDEEDVGEDDEALSHCDGDSVGGCIDQQRHEQELSQVGLNFS